MVVRVLDEWEMGWVALSCRGGSIVRWETNVKGSQETTISLEQSCQSFLKKLTWGIIIT